MSLSTDAAAAEPRAKRLKIQRRFCCVCRREFYRRPPPSRESWADDDKCIACMKALMSEKQKQEQGEETDNSSDSDSSSNENQWEQRHRPITLELMKHGVYIYDCDPIRCHLQGCDLDGVEAGDYDIIFGQFETLGAGPYFDHGDILRKWAMSDSSGLNTCQIFDNSANSDSDDDDDDDEDDEDEEEDMERVVVKGRILLDMPYPGLVPSEISFHQKASDEVDIVTKPSIWEGSYGREIEFKMVVADTELLWIPHESVRWDSTYAQNMRQAMERHNNVPLLWLCHHKSIPEAISASIRRYMSPTKPKPRLSIKRGDLWIQITMQEYDSSFDVELLVRRQQTRS